MIQHANVVFNFATRYYAAYGQEIQPNTKFQHYVCFIRLTNQTAFRFSNMLLQFRLTKKTYYIHPKHLIQLFVLTDIYIFIGNTLIINNIISNLLLKDYGLLIEH